MQGLDRNFGVDASVDAGTAAAIGGYLETHAPSATGKRAEPTGTRITETRWFRHEHDEIAAATWKRPDLRSPANCGACHREAERGDFTERRVRVPGAFLTAESERVRDVHVALGYMLMGPVAFRLLWGDIGSRHARFASFACGPKAVFAYFASQESTPCVRTLGLSG